MGEGIPAMLPRIEACMPGKATNLKRSMGDYLRDNFFYTFSGFNFLPPFLALFLQVGAGRIMFSADYPYSSMQSASSFLDSLSVSPADKEMIAHGNAERLLNM